MEQNLLFTDFIHLEKLQSVLRKLCTFVKIGCCIVAPNGEIIIEVDWDCLCTKNRQEIKSTDFRQCIDIQRFFKGNDITRWEKQVFTCRNGFCTIGAPINIDGLNLASIFVGPFAKEPGKHELSSPLPLLGRRNNERQAPSPPLFSPERIQRIIDHLGIFVELIEEMGRNQVLEKRTGQALKKSEERYRNLVDSLPQIVFETDRQGRIVFLNHSAREILGFTEDLPGNVIDLSFFLPDNEHARLINRFNRTLNGELLPAAECMFRRSNGDIFPVLLSSRPIEDNDGGVSGVRSVLFDMSEHRQVELELLESELRYKALFEKSQDALLLIEEDKIAGCNIKATELFHKSRSDLVGVPFSLLVDSLTAGDGDQASKNLDALFSDKEQESKRLEWRFTLADGQQIETEVEVNYVNLPGRSITQMTLHDITRSNQDKRRLKTRESAWRALFQHAPFGIAINRLADGVYLDVNPALLKISGKSISEILGKSSYDFMTPSQRRAAKKIAEALLAKGFTGIQESAISKPDGSTRSVLYSAATYQSGDEVNVVSMVVDITERKAMEGKIRQSEATLQSLYYAVPIGLAILKDRVIHAANERLVEITGYSIEALVDHSSRFLYFSDEDFAAVGKALYHTIDNRGRGYVETRFRHRDGSTRYISLFAAPLDPTNLQGGSAVAIQDITEQKRMTQALQDSEERLQQHNVALLSLVSRGTLFQSDLQQAVAEVTEASSALINTERVSVWLYSEDYADIRCIDLYNQSVHKHSFGETLQSKEFPFYTASHRKGELISVVDVYTDLRTHDIPAAYYKERGIRSLLDAPVWLHDRLGGILSFEHVGEQRVWTHEDERLASNMAALLTLCFETDERKRAQAALQKSESQLANAVKIAKLGHWELDIESGVFTFTDSLYDIFHTTANDVGGYQMSISEYIKRFVHTEDAWCVTEEFHKSVETNDSNLGYQLEHRVFYADGGIGYIAVRYFVVKNHHGKTIKTYGVNQDITERKLAEIAVQESELRYRSLFEGAGDAILIMKDGVIVDCNQKTLDILQCAREEIIGRSLEEFAPPEQPDGQNSVAQSKQLFSEAEQGKNLEFEWVICRPNGSSFFSEVSLRSIDLSGYLVAQTIVRDISERKKNEKFLRESEFRFRSFFNTNPEGILLLDFQGRILDANKAFLRNSGYTLSECRMTHFKEFVPERDQGKIVQALLNLKSGISQQEPLQSSYRAKDDRIVPVSFRGWLVVDEESKPIYLGVFIKDLTTEKALIADKNALEKQVIRAQKSEAIGTLAGGIAHDFNNILGGIIGYTELALYRNPAAIDPKIKGYIERVLEGGNRAKKLVQQILRFSRNTDTVMGPINLIPLVKETLLLLQSTLPKTITFEKNIAADPDKILGDSTQIHQVIMNLATNAYHAMRETGGILSVTIINTTLLSAKRFMTMTIPPGEYIKITIADTGCGMSPEIVERIFEPYFTTKGVDEGTGLGMAVVAGIVKSHKGLIEIETALGKGSVFDIYFPSFQGGNTDEELFDSTLPLGKGEKILIVDDEAYFLEVVYENLKMLGYNVQCFQRSLEALQEIRNNPNQYDLLITDQTMPEMTGVQLIQEVRKVNASLPIILCTGFSEIVTKKSASYYGIDRFLMKPVNVNEMAKAVAEILSQLE
jgi:PAS domain S-box-containing protein